MIVERVAGSDGEGNEWGEADDEMHGLHYEIDMLAEHVCGAVRNQQPAVDQVCIYTCMHEKLCVEWWATGN